MFLDKLKTLALIAAVALGLAACVALAAGPSPAPTEPPAPKTAPVLVVVQEPAPAKAEPKPLPQGPNKLLFYRAGRLTLIDPDGKNEKDVTKADDYVALHPEQLSLSPDGRRVAVLAPNELPAGNGRAEVKVWVRDLDKDGRGTDLGDGMLASWSGDGAELVVTNFTDGPPGTDPKATHDLVNLATKARTRLKLPQDHLVTDWSRDGKFFLTTQVGTGENANGDKKLVTRIWVMNRDGTEHKAVTGGKAACVLGKFSPDAGRVLFMVVEEPEGKRREYRKLTVVDLATGKATLVEDIPLNAEVHGYCWSPDGKKIAYTWRQVPPAGEKPAADQEAESFLVVCDPDGKNAKTVATEKAGLNRDAIGGVDWR